MTTPRIYVGTYAKYNAESIAGQWLDLEDYRDKDDFLAACAELHKDEADPELMFQDFEGFPRTYYSESSIDPALWDWLALKDDERELLDLYRENVNDQADIREAQDHYQGKYDSPTDWAEQFLEDTHPAFSRRNKENEILVQYFDFAAYAHDAELNGDLRFIRADDGRFLVFWNH